MKIGLGLNVTAIIISLPLVPVVSYAQQQQAPAPVFRMATETVEVDVAVRDSRSGRAVRDLRREDFSVFENGRKQRISHFGLLTQMPLPPAGVREQGVFSNRPLVSGPPNAVAVLLDGLNARFEDAVYAARGAAKALRGTQVRGMVGVYSLRKSGLGVLHDYSGDAQMLARMLREGPALWDSVENRGVDADLPGAVRPKAQDENRELTDRIRYLDTLHALVWIAQHLRSVPGTKSIVWISAGFPIRTVINNFPDWERAMRAINDCNVAVYAVDSSGVRTTAAFAADRATTRSLPVRPIMSRANASNDVLKEAAFSTGGLAFGNTNDLGDAVESALRDSECMYRLAYTPDARYRDGRFMRIQVNVNRRGVAVGHRGGYYSINEARVAGSDRERATLTAVHSPVDATGIGLTARLTNTEKAISVLLAADPSSVVLRHEGTRYTGGLDIRYAQKSAAGSIVDDITDEVTLALNEAQYRQIKTEGFAYSKELVKAPGARILRIVVCDHLTGIVGSISLPVGGD